MAPIDTKAINEWFEKLAYHQQVKLSSEHLNTSNADMLSQADIIVIYVRCNY